MILVKCSLSFSPYIFLQKFCYYQVYDSGRLAGATLIAPVINYWWPGFPANLSKEAYYQQFPQDQWALRVAHYTPWLTYWWNTQKLFPASSVIGGKPQLSRKDMEIIQQMPARPRHLVSSYFFHFALLRKETNNQVCLCAFVCITIEQTPLRQWYIVMESHFNVELYGWFNISLRMVLT